MFDKRKFLTIMLIATVLSVVVAAATVSAASYSSAHNSGPVKVVKSVTATSSNPHNSISSGSPVYDYEGRDKRIARAKALYAKQKLS